MVQKFTGYKAEDGKVFETEALALAHEKFLSLGAAVKAVLTGLGFEDGVVIGGTSENSIPLRALLLDNSEALVEALTPPKRERKPRASKDPAEPSKPLAEALNAVAAGPVVVPGALEESHTTVAEVAPVNTEAGSDAEDELAKLLGGEASATVSTEVAV